MLGEFRGRGNAFLANVFDSAKYLEDLTGINESFHYRDDDAVSVFRIVVSNTLFNIKKSYHRKLKKKKLGVT